MKFLRLCALVALLMLAALGTAAQAQDIGTPYAVVQDGDLWVYGVGDEPVMVSEGTQGGFGSITWSDDGTILAFIRYNEDFSTSLMYADVIDLASPVEVSLSSRLEGGFPISFTPDNLLLFAEQPADLPQSDQPYQTGFYTVALEEGAEPQLVAVVDYIVGCGGGSSIPADWAYWAETGFGGSYLTLEWVGSGIIYSTACSGTGTALLNLETQESTVLGTNLARVRLSPDGTKLAGIGLDYDNDTIVATLQIVDLVMLEASEITTADMPDQVAWGVDGTLFYSARKVSGNLLEGLTAEQLAAITAGIGFEVPNISAFEVTIHQIDLASPDSDTVVYTGEAFAIGRMIAVDEQTLVFSQIPNLDAWIEGFASGTLNSVAEDYMQQAQTLVVAEAFALNLSDESTESLGTGLAQITPYVAS